MTKSKMKQCSFRIPVAEKIDTPYLERWSINCGCGVTIFGNSKEDAERTWREHVHVESKRVDP